GFLSELSRPNAAGASPHRVGRRRWWEGKDWGCPGRGRSRPPGGGGEVPEELPEVVAGAERVEGRLALHPRAVLEPVPHRRLQVGHGAVGVGTGEFLAGGRGQLVVFPGEGRAPDEDPGGGVVVLGRVV